MLTDTDTMPFGKYERNRENKKMQDVPASYFHYLWTNGLRNDATSDVAQYIRANLEALKKEHPDGIWE